MFFNKIRHPANFLFAVPAGGGRHASPFALGGKSWTGEVTDLGEDVHRIQFSPTEGGWKNPSQARLDTRFSGPSAHRVSWTGDRLVVSRPDEVTPLLSGCAGGTFGVCGDAWMLQFQHHAGMKFFGLGEHSQGWEKSGQRVKFWNNDMWAEFSLHEIRHHSPNPMYVSLPWLIIKQGDVFLGLLVHHPGAVFMDLASSFIWSPENQEDRARQSFFVGAPDGGADVFLIVGPDLPALTRKLQRLVGTTPRPPLWALGHHQCRWGYAGPKDLQELDQGFTRHAIPTDGLWLDIDYMERYRVFTWNRRHWGSEAKVKKELAALAAHGRKVVPILDPGVKVEDGYEVMEEGLRKGVFCLNPAGLPYVGFVWPGRTYYPDFSLPEGRRWWSRRVQAFAELGVAGAWLDMNDPSVGAVELDDMKFGRGAYPHEHYHNQYALGMAEASYDGFLAARPHERPFLLSRSAYISSSRYTAVWTGDNYSNWKHLRACIPLSLGLALSGQPFNGPDVAGFGDDTTPELAIAWYKTGFLFPFFRNHTTSGTRRQEPWALGATACRIIGHYIRLRYKFLPYLYQLFIAQERAGEAVLRPLMYGHRDSARQRLSLVDDQFLVGPDVLQAPLVHEEVASREVLLPAGQLWYSAQDGRWRRGGGRHRVRSDKSTTPLYFREGALVPLRPGPCRTPTTDLAEIELHVFLTPTSRGEHSGSYTVDDGHSFDYRNGGESTYRWSARVKRKRLELTVTAEAPARFPLRVSVCVHAPFREVVWRQAGGEQVLTVRRAALTLTGKRLSVGRTPVLTIGNGESQSA